MAIDEAGFRAAMSHFASGVTVVTCRKHGEAFGMTVASFASLSLRPPLILVCIENSVKTHEAIVAAGSFAVNILSSDQEEVSRQFASRVDDRFAGIALKSREGDPLLEGALATIQCKLRDQLPGGDHTIFVGEVISAEWREGDPLLYFRSGYPQMK